MNNIIGYFNSTKDKDFIDCRITSLRDYFGYNNLSLDSYDIFVLSRVIDCSLLKFKLKKDSPLKLCLLGGSKLEIEQDLFEFLGIEYKHKHFSDDIRSEIKEYIDKGQPIIARFDIRYLFDPNIIKKQYDVHCISSTVICGYDFSEDCVYIELKEKRNKTLKKVKISDFEKAISSQTFPMEVERTFFTLDIEENKIKEITNNRKNLLWDALRKTCESMLFGGEMILDNNYEYKNIRVGLFNLQEVIKVNNKLKKSLSNPKMAFELKQRLVALYSLTMRDMLTPGSNFCFRKEFGETLIVMSKKLKEKNLAKIGVQFKYISRLWRELTRTLTFTIKNVNDEKVYEYFNKVNSLLEEIYYQEYKQFQRLYILT